jgi:hypothetical protein
VLNTPDWVRLALILALGLGVAGLWGWLASILVGALVAWGLHWLFSWSWAFSLQLGLAGTFTLPLFFRVLWANFRLPLIFAIVPGLPAFLLSRFYLGYSLPYAIFEGFIIMNLLPFAVIRILVLLGIIGEPPIEPPGLKRGKEPDLLFKGAAPKDSTASSPITIDRRWP